MQRITPATAADLFDIAATRRITDHIISNGYYIIDLDGKPTKWGKWSLDYLPHLA
eukprot:gene51312-68680_t